MSGLTTAERQGRTRGSPAVAALTELLGFRDPERARLLQRYFKTGPGEYGEGDRFLGLRVPQVRAIARRHRGLPLPAMLELLGSEWHEARLLALLLMVQAHEKAGPAERATIAEAWLANTDRINNWDLVDLSAGRILGPHAVGRRSALLTRLARSRSVWERRIAVMATSHTIGEDRFEPTFRIAKQLLADPHDLIHKAAGWMLREVGNRDRAALEGFLDEHHAVMPRTMLRYAIEKFPADRRQWYLRGTSG
jgi:3-methyladenine DNA glycosylase AlkD